LPDVNDIPLEDLQLNITRMIETNRNTLDIRVHELAERLSYEQTIEINRYIEFLIEVVTTKGVYNNRRAHSKYALEPITNKLTSNQTWRLAENIIFSTSHQTEDRFFEAEELLNLYDLLCHQFPNSM
jgi:hypothetical protein